MRHWILLLLLLTFATPALAVDGVLEINQACAVNTGCLSGDLPGFPVTIAQSGSYRLTSDLTMSTNTKAILAPFGAQVDDVTLDLNGFTIDGGTGNTDNAIQLSDGDNWEIRGGTVRGFAKAIQQQQISTGHRVIGVRVSDNAAGGITLNFGEGHLVQDCTISENGGTGIATGDGSTVHHNTVRNNGGNGISTGAFSRVTENNVRASNLAGVTTGVASVVSGNMLQGNGTVGVLCNQSCLINDNIAQSNSSHGIHCISNRCTVEGNSVDFNGGHGIFIGGSGQSLVTGNRVTSNTLNGLNAGTTTAYGGNVFTGNSAGDVSGGIEIGTNVCGTNTTCP